MLRPTGKKDGGRSSTASEGGDAVVNKDGRCASRGFNPGVGAYFTVCGPISRRQSEPAWIHHRVTPRNNVLDHNELLSKPSYLFISPHPAASLAPSFSRSLSPTITQPSALGVRTDPRRYPLQLGSAHFSKPRRNLFFVRMYSFFFPRIEKTFAEQYCDGATFNNRKI